MPLITPAAADDVHRSVGLERDVDNGMVLVVVTDCDGGPVQGTTIEVPGAERVLYLGADTRFDPQLAEASIDSAALVLGVPPGPVDLIVERGDHRFDAFPQVFAHADVLTTTWRRP